MSPPARSISNVAGDTYCRISDLARYLGERASVFGFFIADRSHRKVTGDQFKFITICDYAVIECEILPQTYRLFGLEPSATRRRSREARVTPFDTAPAARSMWL